MSVVEFLKQIDVRLLHTVNQQWSNRFFDSTIPWLRYQQLWYPFYLFLIVFALWNFGKKGAWWISGFVINIGLSDSISSRLVKYSVARLRPCSDPEVFPWITLRVPHCSGGYSFTSSHAANHFAMAMFLFITFMPFAGKKMAWIFVWAGLIGFAQIYVGVHYPFDVLGGALLGCLIGFVTGTYFNKKVGLA